MRISFHLLDEALGNTLDNTCYLKRRKIKFKNFILSKEDVTREKLEHALKIPADSGFDRLNGRQFLSTKWEQRKITNWTHCLYNKKVGKESRHHFEHCSDHPGLCPTPSLIFHNHIMAKHKLHKISMRKNFLKLLKLIRKQYHTANSNIDLEAWVGEIIFSCGRPRQYLSRMCTSYTS